MGWFSNTVQLSFSAAGLGVVSTALAQVDINKLEKRIQKLEDPISAIHRDVPKLCEVIHKILIEKDNDPRTLYEVSLTSEQRHEYDSVLKVLNAKGIITIPLDNRKNGPVSCKFRIQDPMFCLYIFELFGPKLKIQQLKEYLDNYQSNIWYEGTALALDFEIPIEIPDAFFSLARARGQGLKSDTIGESSFTFY